LFLSIATQSANANDRSSFYAGLRLVGSVADLDDVSATGFSGPLQDNHSDDLVAGGGGVFGYRWGRWPIRTEVEIIHRVRFDWDFRDTGTPAVGYENNVDSTNLLFNLLFEYRNMSDFTPFIGGTLGWAHNNSSVDRSNVGTNITTSQSNAEDNLAWGIMLGLDWAFASNWGAEIAYRFLNLGPVSTGVFPTGEEVSAENYIVHDVMISAMYNW
jgi:opacity protein-like surface antigen